MKFKYIFKKPDRDRLWGMSPSQFKTLLKRKGFKVDRDFFKMGAMAKKGNRLYRFRYWAFPDFFVLLIVDCLFFLLLPYKKLEQY